MNTFLIKALGIAALACSVAWGLHTWLESAQDEGRAEVQALWDADKAAAAESERRRAEADKARAAQALDEFLKTQAAWAAKLRNAQNEIAIAAQKLESCAIDVKSVSLLDCLSNSSAENCAAR